MTRGSLSTSLLLCTMFDVFIYKADAILVHATSIYYTMAYFVVGTGGMIFFFLSLIDFLCAGCSWIHHGHLHVAMCKLILVPVLASWSVSWRRFPAMRRHALPLLAGSWQVFPPAS